MKFVILAIIHPSNLERSFVFRSHSKSFFLVESVPEKQKRPPWNSLKVDTIGISTCKDLGARKDT